MENELNTKVGKIPIYESKTVPGKYVYVWPGKTIGYIRTMDLYTIEHELRVGIYKEDDLNNEDLYRYKGLADLWEVLKCNIGGS